MCRQFDSHDRIWFHPGCTVRHNWYENANKCKENIETHQAAFLLFTSLASVSVSDAIRGNDRKKSGPQKKNGDKADHFAFKRCGILGP